MPTDSSRKQPNVTVVGAGIVGAAIAYSLAKRGADVTVIDKGRPGGGATSHSFAWINATAKHPVSYHNFNRRSLGMWDRFAKDLDTDVGLRWGGQIEWAATAEGAADLESRAAQLQAWGYPCQMLDGDQMVQLEPGLTPGQVAAAIYCELDGMVEPTVAAEACIRAAVKNGTSVSMETEVTSLRVNPNSATVVAGGVEIAADVVVLAGGVDNTQLAAMVGITIPQQHSPGVVIRTSPIAQPLLSKASVVYAPPLEPGRPEIHLRQCLDGSAMIGEGSQESLARNDTQPHANELLARAAEYVPGLKGASAIPVPVGYRPMPLDGFPVVGFSPKAPNVYLALTHSGVTLAPMMAQMATMEIMDGANVDLLGDYRPSRFD
ncbi:MAG: FAD-dependent oxidoreductase [Chloroflexota bacterium]|uniref:FAD dependent oxidoreductase domain-containing protein n=1 Tax=marine metagenome TaxID=408172 RepID=A0A381NTZ3_9ZZZZ|nr:FAD-dependent oxidoreductase [Chloroflexota bacterium]